MRAGLVFIMGNVTSDGKKHERGSTDTEGALIDTLKRPTALRTGRSWQDASTRQEDGHMLGDSFCGPACFSLRTLDNLWTDVPNLNL